MRDELSARTLAYALDSSGDDHQIPLGLRYSRNTPFEIGFEFEMLYEKKTVYASREIIRQGLYHPTGDYGVRAQRCKMSACMCPGVMITLPLAEYGRFDIMIHRDAMKWFVEESYKLLPKQNECVYFELEVDAAISRILADT